MNESIDEVLEECLQEWLESESGKCIKDAYGVDGYVCVINFIEFVKENRDANTDGY